MYNPKWEETINVAKEIANKNVWRTIYLSIDREDLEQEAYFVFLKCTNERYTYENEKHFFSFFRLSLKNYITDMIKNKRDEKELVVQYSFENEEGESLLENVGATEESSDFETKLNEAPEEIRSIITLLQNYPKELITLNRITNKRLCDLLGYDSKNRNILNELKIYFNKGE